LSSFGVKVYIADPSLGPPLEIQEFRIYRLLAALEWNETVFGTNPVMI
jgi:hypothetical protein